MINSKCLCKVAIAPDERVSGKYFSYFSMKTCCGYSLEMPHRGTSNEYPQHMFSWRNKKNSNTFWLEKCALPEAMGCMNVQVFLALVIYFLWHFAQSNLPGNVSLFDFVQVAAHFMYS